MPLTKISPEPHAPPRPRARPMHATLLSGCLHEPELALSPHRLDAVAQKLLEVETLSRDDFEKIFPPPTPHNPGTPSIVED